MIESLNWSVLLCFHYSTELDLLVQELNAAQQKWKDIGSCQGDNLAVLFVCCERLADTLSLECAVQVVLL